MLFIVYLIFPIVEIYLLFEASKNLGFFTVLGLVIFTAWLGSRLVKSQGLYILSQFQAKMNQGHLPQKEALDGLLILFAGVLLIAPGFITDFLGILCVIPFTRKYVRELLAYWIQRKVKQGRIKVYSNVSYTSSSNSAYADGVDPFNPFKTKPEVRDVGPSGKSEEPPKALN